MLSDLPRDMAEEVLSRLPVTSLRELRSACKRLSKNRSHAQATKKEELTTKTTTMYDLPRDLAEEVFYRLPVTSLRGFRSACKNWNTLSKDRSFTKKHVAQAKAAAARESMVVMVIDFRVYLMTLNLHRGVDPSINCQGKLISLTDSDRVDISENFHCDGLLLCITKDYNRFVVWNPYVGQTLWFELGGPPYRRDRFVVYALGYENSKSRRNYKVLRFFSSDDDSPVEYEMYELNSNSWRVLDVVSNAEIEFDARGVSLKGNTYWYAREEFPETGRYIGSDVPDFLICFDFTKEKFGPNLPLPFHAIDEDGVTFSSVREEQLAVLFQRWDTLYMEVWVTTKIEPEVVLWNKLFLAADMELLNSFQFADGGGSFFIDEEDKVVVVFDKDKDRDNVEVETTRRNTAYITGEDGYYKEVDLGESTEERHYPIGCSYVPSSLRIKQRGKRKRKRNLIIN